MSISVNGEIITDQEIDSEVESLRPYYDRLHKGAGDTVRPEQLREWASENLIERVLYRQLAQRDPESVDLNEVEDIYLDMCGQADSPQEYLAQSGLSEGQLRADIVNSIKLNRLQDKIVSTVGPASIEQMQAYYNENKELFVQPAMVEADQIAIAIDKNTSSKAAKEEIDSLAKKLGQGRSFDDLMKNNSDAGLEDGKLGWFSPGEMLPEFDEVVFKMKAGQVSKPFKTEIGWHIVRVNKIQSESVMSFDEVKNHIADHLYEELQEQALADFIDAEKEKAQILR